MYSRSKHAARAIPTMDEHDHNRRDRRRTNTNTRPD